MDHQPTWRKFEREVGLLVRAFGYDVEVTPPSNDYGADVVAIKKGRRVAIQCKLYATGRIGHPVIINLSGARNYYQADEAMCFTTTTFSRQAIEAAQRLSVHLVDRKRLLELCREVAFTLPSLTCLHVDQRFFPLHRDGLTSVGRDSSCQVHLESRLVSRVHAKFLRQGGRLLVEDVGSTNGTQLNGTRLTEPSALNYGDNIVFGDVRANVVMRSEER